MNCLYLFVDVLDVLAETSYADVFVTVRTPRLLAKVNTLQKNSAI